MFNLFAIVPFFILLALAYYMNSKKIKDTKLQILILSLLETTFGYLFLLMIFLQSFYPETWYFVLNIFLILVVSVILYFFIRGTYEDTDLQIETIKNIIVIFTLTILPLYVFLTVFRFMPFYLQIVLSLLATSLIVFLSINAKIYDRSFYKKIKFKLSYVDAKGKFILIWGMIGLTVIIIFLFQFPSNTVGETLNLSNNVNYLSYDGFPTDINNNFYQEEIIKFSTDVEFRYSENITDYFYDDNYLYFYTSANKLYIYNLETEELIFDKQLDLATYDVDEYDESLLKTYDNYNRFIYYDNQILLFGMYNTYVITNNSVTNISLISDYYSMYYFKDNELYFLNKDTSGIFHLYTYEDDNIVFTETIDLSSTLFDSLIVVSENLFYKNPDKYNLYYGNYVNFDNLNGTAIYDSINQVMYYSSNNLYDTHYYKVNSYGTVLSILFEKEHNINGIIIGDYIYYTNDSNEEITNIEIFKSSLEVDSNFNHLESDKFWIGNKINTAYIGNYNVNGDLLEFIQVEKSKDYTTISIYQLVQKDVDIDFPFYAHYGIGIFIPIIIAFFIPITNYKETIVVLDQSKSYYDKQI